MKLIKGQWAYYPIDDPMPDKLNIFEGCWKKRRKVGEINRYQAMAYRRHWDNGGVYYGVQDGNYRWIDIRLVGDVDAFYGDGE